MNIRIDATQEHGLVVERDTKRLTVKSEQSGMASFLETLLTSVQNVNDISSITVNPGPGYRFTRTRQSVIVANACGYALKVPVNGKTFEVPIYYKEPNITVDSQKQKRDEE